MIVLMPNKNHLWKENKELVIHAALTACRKISYKDYLQLSILGLSYLKDQE